MQRGLEPSTASGPKAKANAGSDGNAARPVDLNFPRPQLDGSLPDLIVTTPREPTPPAALSTLGLKSKAESEAAMARDMAESTSSLADGQYDMMDDVSDVSTNDAYADDADTVSLTSSERDSSVDGEDTPEETSSAVDEAEVNRSLNRDDTQPTPSRSFVDLSDFRQYVDRALSSTTDSFLSEDLETPRQSTLDATVAARRIQQQIIDGSAVPSPDKREDVKGPLSVLFMSDLSVTAAWRDEICTRITAALADADPSQCRVSKVKTTSTSTKPYSSALYECNGIELSVIHCTDVRPVPSSDHRYVFRTLTDVDDQSSYCVLDLSGKSKTVLPDFAIFFTAPPSYEEPAYFSFTRSQVFRDPYMTTLTVGKQERGIEKVNKGYECKMSLATFCNLDSEMLKDTVVGILRRHILPRESVKGAKVTTSAPSPIFNPAKTTRKAIAMMFMLLAILALMTSWFQYPKLDPIAEQAVRKDVLVSALSKVTNSSAPHVSATFDLNHLLPASHQAPTNQSAAVYCQGAQPNQMVISLPKGLKQSRFASSTFIKVHKSGHSIPFNQTKLMDGIYHIAIDPREAYGLVNFDMVTKNPAFTANVSHNYGNRMLKKQTYERALSKNVDSAKRLHTEIGPSYRATRNVTSQLALQMVKDLQVFAKAAVSFGDKASKAGNETATQVRKDIVLFQKDLVKFTKDLQKTVGSAASSMKALVPSKKSIGAPFAKPQQRAAALKAKTTSWAKNKICPKFKRKESRLTRRITDVSNLARCSLKSGDFKGCRAEMDAKNKLTSNALSTLPGSNAIAEFYGFSADKRAKKEGDKKPAVAEKCCAKHKDVPKGKKDKKGTKHATKCTKDAAKCKCKAKK